MNKYIKNCNNFDNFTRFDNTIGIIEQINKDNMCKINNQSIKTD